MNCKKLAAVCGNILIGLLVSALAVLFVPAASSVGRRVWLKILIALVTLVLSVLLLRSRNRGSRQCRSIAAIIGYLPVTFLLGRLGVHDALAQFIRNALNRSAEMEMDDAVAEVFLYLPGAALLILFASLLAWFVSRAPKDNRVTKP